MSGAERPCPCGKSSVIPYGGSEGMKCLRCRTCGLLVREPIPDSDELQSWYKREYWRQYRKEQIGTARENVYQHVLVQLGRIRPSRGVLVDVGCGAGSFLALSAAEGWQGIGFDPSSEAVAHAQAIGIQADVLFWPPSPLSDESADAVTFINVLDHLSDPFEALSEAWRILRPKGLLYIRVPNGRLHLRLKSILSPIGLGGLPVFHIFGFGCSAFRYHLPRLGFRICWIRTTPPSRRDSYGGEGWILRLLKMTDRASYLALTGLGLAGLGWGLSLEVMACKETR